MAQFFFDIHANGIFLSDSEGVDLPDLDAVRHEAMTTLPAMAKEGGKPDSDQLIYIVVARDRDRRAVFSATLSVTGIWLTPH